jgi:hypothetical protein
MERKRPRVSSCVMVRIAQVVNGGHGMGGTPLAVGKAVEIVTGADAAVDILYRNASYLGGRHSGAGQRGEREQGNETQRWNLPDIF